MSRSPRRALDEQERLVCAGDARPLLDALAHESRVGRRRYLLHVLERVLASADPGAIDDATLDAAAAAGVPRDAVPPAPAAPPHAVLVPFVAPGGRAFVRTLFVTYRPYGDEDELDLTATSRVAASRAIAAAAARLGRSVGGGGADGYTLAAAQPAVFQGLRVDGSSLAAAAFVSATSLWTRRPVRPATAITGAIAPGGAITSVGGIEAKRAAVQEGPFRVARLIVPASDRDALEGRGSSGARHHPERIELLGVRDVDTLVREALEARALPAPSLDTRVRSADRAFRGGWQRWQWPGLRAELEPLLADLPPQRPDLVVEVSAMLAGVLRHVGELDASVALVARAEAVRDADPEGVPDAPIAKLDRQKAMSLRQLGALRDASRAARAAIAAAKRGRLRGELIPSHGTAGLVALSCGDARAAIRHQRAALDLARLHTPASAPRAASYLIEALGHAGLVDEAAEVFTGAQRDIADHTSSAARGNREAWLRTTYAGALLRTGDASGARRALDHLSVRDAIATEPFPGLQARRWLGLALCHAGRVDEGLTWLAHSPSAYGRLLAGHALALAHQNVLHEARVRLSHRRLDGDARARARVALYLVPTARWLLPYVERCSETLEHTSNTEREAAHEELNEALGALLDACERLG